jgi:hypothetical protein
MGRLEWELGCILAQDGGHRETLAHTQAIRDGRGAPREISAAGTGLALFRRERFKLIT